MDIQETLTQLNLTEREAKIYTTLLELGSATPLVLANKTGLKRPTVYLDLESLKRRRLVSVGFLGKRVVYQPASPSRLLQQLQKQQNILEEALPFLLALENRKKTKPVIRYFEGIENVKRVWREETYRAKENCYISHVALLEKLFQDMLNEYNEKIRNGSIRKVREIVTSSPEDLRYAKKYRSSNRQIRIMPKEYQFSIDISLWENSVGLFSFENLSMLVITSPQIAKSFRTIFALAWEASTHG